MLYLLFLLVVTHSFDDVFYTSWKYGGSVFNYGMLSETQRLGCNFVKEYELSTETFNVRNGDYLLYPLITSDNHVMVLVHEIPVFSLFIYDQYLSLEAKYDIIDDIYYFIPSTEGPFSMYQEYNNHNYFVHQIVYVDRSTDNDQFVYLLIVIEIKENNNANILWQFKYNRLYSKPGDYGTFYQHVVYKNYVFFQHATDSTGNNINRYVFDVNEGCILWNSSTSNKNDYHYKGAPVIFEDEEDDSILMVIDNSYNLYAIDMKTGDMKWENDMNGFSLIGRSTDRYMASIDHKYKLLLRGCYSNDMGQPAICVFDVTNGHLLNIDGYNEQHPKLRSFVLNNYQNTLMVMTETAAIYYDIIHVVDVSNITLIENQIVLKQYREFYWMDNESNVMFSIDGYYGNNCSERSSRESFIVSRSGTESQSVCIGLDGNYPVIPNKQISSEQYVYFTSDEQLIAFKSPIRSTTTTTNKPTYKPTVYDEANNMDYNSSKSINSTNIPLPPYNHTQFVTTETTDFCLSTGSENISISNMDTTSISISSGDSKESFIAETLGIVFGAIIIIICILCYIHHRHRYRIRGQNAQIPNNVAVNDESDFYPKKPASSVQRAYNENEMEMNVEKNRKEEIENERKTESENDDIEMIVKQPTLSYSAVHCVICLDILLEHESSKLFCGHRFHTHCIEEYNETKQHCPLCRKPIVFV